MFKRRGSDHWWTSRRVDGTRRFFSLSTSDPKLAAIAEKELDVRIAKGKIIGTPKGTYMSVSELLTKYVEEHSKPNKRAWQTDIDLSKALTRHMGSMRLTDVRPSHLANFVSARRKEPTRGSKVGVSNTTIHQELVLLRHAFKHAIHPWELVSDTPFKNFSLPKRNPHRVRFFEEEEITAIFNVIRNQAKNLAWLEPMIIVARDTGLRRENIARLTWDMVDFKQRYVFVPDTKSGKPHSVPMTEEAYKALMRLWENRRQQKVLSLSGSDCVFVKESGEPYSLDSVTHAFEKACEFAGVKNARFHDLRHDCASRLAMAGMNQRVIQEFLGHATLRMSEKYTHLRRNVVLEQAAEALNKNYRRVGG